MGKLPYQSVKTKSVVGSLLVDFEVENNVAIETQEEVSDVSVIWTEICLLAAESVAGMEKSRGNNGYSF